MKNQNMICRVIGAIMILVGVVLFALSIKVNSGYGAGFRFVRWGNVNLGAVLIVLLVFEVVAYVALYNIQPWMQILKVAMLGTAVVFGIVFIVSLNFYFERMSLLQFIIYLGLIGIGTGLLIRGRLADRKKDTDKYSEE